jgi:hypothetical protein
MIIYLLLGVFAYGFLEKYMEKNNDSMLELLKAVLDQEQHKELKEAYSVTTLHFLFSGFCILLWPVILILLVIK